MKMLISILRALRTPSSTFHISRLTRRVPRAAFYACLALGLVGRCGAATVNHAGLAHTPVGNASVSESGGMLDVSGLDSSGSNGVAIALGGGRGWRGDFGEPLILMDGDSVD